MAARELFHVAFRVDASPEIGLGHMMRCLTLAHALREAGARSLFICRGSSGPGARLAVDAGFPVRFLDDDTIRSVAEDAALSEEVLRQGAFGWVVLDHYGLGREWESAIRRSDRKLLAMEDLPNRPHVSDILLDPTFGRRNSEYDTLVPNDCILCLDTGFALLRPEFGRLRSATLRRRSSGIGPTPRVLVSFGGGETSDAVLASLAALPKLEFAGALQVTVVLGGSQDREREIRALAESLFHSVEIVGFDADIARRMADADIAIGAAGGSTWERCCLGLPAILLELAENQGMIARALVDAGAAYPARADPAELSTALDRLLQDRTCYAEMSRRAADICSGDGAARVVDAMVKGMQKMAP